MVARGRRRRPEDPTASPLDELVALLRSDQLGHVGLNDGTGVVLDIEHCGVLALNEAANFLVAKLRDGVGDRDELRRLLVEVFDVEPVSAERDIRLFVEQMWKLLVDRRSRSPSP